LAVWALSELEGFFRLRRYHIIVRTASLLRGIALLGLALVFASPTLGQELKGQLKIGIHKVKLEKGRIYQLFVESEANPPPTVSVDWQAGAIRQVYGKDFRDVKHLFVPTTDENSFFVLPGYGSQKDATIEYTLKIKVLDFEKPLVDEKNKLTDKDPTFLPPPDNFGPKNVFYKPYKVKLKEGKLVVIDMVRTAKDMDPYLFLEGPDGKIVAQDDDGGGDRNARILFTPHKDGEYRIIATTLDRTTGEYTLTARVAKD
jgi:hypothetical protein